MLSRRIDTFALTIETRCILTPPFRSRYLTMSAEARIAELGIDLNQPSPPIANYVSTVRVGNLLFVSGHGPRRPGSSEMVIGKLGDNMSVEQGYEAARLVGIQVLASIKRDVGSLDEVKRCVKALGMVNCTADFGDQPAVVNGFSDLMVEVFGDNGKHARSAVGMASLPNGIAVEVELIVELK